MQTFKNRLSCPDIIHSLYVFVCVIHVFRIVFKKQHKHITLMVNTPAPSTGQLTRKLALIMCTQMKWITPENGISPLFKLSIVKKFKKEKNKKNIT